MTRISHASKTAGIIVSIKCKHCLNNFVARIGLCAASAFGVYAHPTYLYSMLSPGSPAFDLSRTRLRQVSHWIRDELDPLVAREGPDQLRADDLLTLHDIFQALKTSSVTALDLRATGIHRAVIEIAGKATRWPGRLADDCDRLIYLWTAKFGPLADLPPFLYGRGGRLEGIASPEESSNAVSSF